MLTIRTARPIGHTASWARPYVCPACGNRDRQTIADNGAHPADPLFTLLCLAQSGPCGDPNPDPADLACGMQWEPNGEA